MKVKVVEIFRDKYTNQVYKLDDILEVDEKRFTEIKAYVEEITEEENEKEKNEANEENSEKVDSEKEKTKQENQKNKDSKK